MNICLLAKNVCLVTPKIIDHFEKNGTPIDCVIIENNYREKFSQNEKKHRQAHDRLNIITKKYSPIRRITKQIWDRTPHFIRKAVQLNIYYIPVFNKFSTKKICAKKGIQTFEVKKHSSEETKKILQSRKIKYAIMASSHWLLKEPIISLPETKIINAHSGWLPKHKGLDSIGWSIKDGDPLGLTTHYIDKGIDTGSILKFYEVKPEKNENLNTIWNKIVAQKPHAFLDTIKSIEENQIEPQNQNDDYPPHIPMTFEELLETNNYFKKITS